MKGSKNMIKNIKFREKFLTKKNIKTLIITIILCFCYILQDILFASGNYNIKIYSSGIHGIGDAIAKIISETKCFLPFSQKPYFVGVFAAIFFIIINILLLLFIAFPKLDFKFSINSLIYSIFFTIILINLSFLINKNNNSLQYCFNFFSKEDSFKKTFLRVIICSCISGIIHGICLRIDSSTAGMDIIAKYISIYKKKDISLIIAILNYFTGIIAVMFLSIYNNYLNTSGLFLAFSKNTLTSIIIYLVINFNFKKKYKNKIQKIIKLNNKEQ